MIETKRITKVFEGKIPVHALEDVDLEAGPGKATALVGPNGAGKTTLIKILSTLITPTSGEARVNGYDVVKNADKVRKSVGLVTVSERLFYFRLSALENLVFYATLYNMPLNEARARSKQLLEEVGLSEWGDTKVMHYSTGMMRRLALARALLHDPPVVMLDEPTLGIDVVSSRSVRRLVRETAKEKTVLFTSHYMKDVEEIAEKIYLINQGKVLGSGSPTELVSSAGKFVEAELVDQAVPKGLEKFIVSSNGSSVILRIPKKVAELLPASGVSTTDVQATLEDVYVFTVGESTMDVRFHQFR
ncbi:MAG: ABC transporter ATP-binding protein, partial [Thermoprotei archaeon]